MDIYEDETNLCFTIAKKDELKFRLCMVESLLAKGANINEKCKKEFYQLKYGLSEEEWDCIRSSNNLVKKIIDLKNSGISDPCNPNKSSNQIISDLLHKICAESGDRFENLTLEIENGDHIIPGKSFKNNPRFSCLWEKLRTSQNSLFCNEIDDFEGKSKLNYQLEMYPSKQIPILYFYSNCAVAVQRYD